MPQALIANNAVTTLSVAISTVGQTAVTVTSAASFPVPTGGNYFYLTILDGANIPEVVKVTSVAGSVFTVVRAQDGTAARTFSTGASARLCLCAAVLAEFVRPDAAVFTGTPTAPTATVGTNNTQLATTAYTTAEITSRFASPTFTGTPIAPTATLGTNSTQIATTAYTVAEIGARAVSSAGGTYTGTYNFTGANFSVPTLAPGTATTGAASTAFVAAASLVAAGIPAQTGNAGKYLATDGANASWETVPASGADIFLANNFGGF